jgi:hypothetical protein
MRYIFLILAALLFARGVYMLPEAIRLHRSLKEKERMLRGKDI